MHYEFIGDVKVSGIVYPECFAVISSYVPNPDVSAIVITNDEGPVITATVNLAEYGETPKDSEHVFLVGDSDLVSSLVEHGFISLSGKSVPYGFDSVAFEAKITLGDTPKVESSQATVRFS